MELKPSLQSELTGEELLLPGVHVQHFWAWAMGDLRLNSTRGMLAQFLVARAVGDTRPNDDGWGDFDVLSPEGIKIEVKSSGYLQSWAQKRSSAIVFTGLTGRTWSAETGRGSTREFRADVFVFAVHTCEDSESYDPIDIDAWDFYVVSGRQIREIGQRSINLNRLRSFVSKPIKWRDLRTTILRCS